jgi:regulator of protease activity HflC (stomatin/prohibitin superfamily)
LTADPPWSGRSARANFLVHTDCPSLIWEAFLRKERSHDVGNGLRLSGKGSRLSHPKATKRGTGPLPSSLPPAIVFIALALLALGEARKTTFLSSVLFDLAGALLVAGAGFLSATLAALARHRDPREFTASNRRDAPRSALSRKRLRARLAGARAAIWNIDLSGEWFAILTTVALSGLAVFSLVKGWPVAEPVPPLLQAWTAGLLIVLVFPFLVLELHFAGTSQQTLPESAQLARLCRLPMLALLGLGVAAAIRWLGFDWAAALIEHGAAIVTGLVALELCLRSAFRWYASADPPAARRSHADSVIAGMLRLQWPNFTGIGASVSRQVGIDLGRSWALGFIRRAALPALFALAVFSWLLTGISALSLSERAVYESFGKPAAVLHPGLHMHLPWPFGMLRPVEFGRVREIPVVFAVEDRPAETQTAVPPTVTDIEGAPPPSTDRLWDASHPSEASYLVASTANGRQNFEVINIDLRVMYRIGLSDEAAREAIYNVASPEEMIRAAAGRMLARYFARYTVLDVLGQNREAFIRGFQQELQSRLAGLSTGIEVMGIVVEAIHPPPAAAPAYQGVQTAAIRSVVHIADARADAAQTMNSAQGNATTMRNDALAAAAERLDAAKTELALFDGDRQAYSAGGQSFLFERRLQHFDRVLAGARFTIIDHRIPKADAPLLDLRPPPLSADSLVPPQTEP